MRIGDSGPKNTSIYKRWVAAHEAPRVLEKVSRAASQLLRKPYLSKDIGDLGVLWPWAEVAESDVPLEKRSAGVLGMQPLAVNLQLC